MSEAFSYALREPVLCMKHFTQLQESVTTIPNKLELFTDDACFVVLSTNLSSRSTCLKVTGPLCTGDPALLLPSGPKDESKWPTLLGQGL